MTQIEQATCHINGNVRHTFGLVDVAAPRTDLVPHGWQLWAAKQLIAGRPVERITADMIAHGFDQATTHATLVDLLSSPGVEAAMSAADQFNKLQSVLNMRQDLRDLSPAGSEIELRCQLSGADFLDDYYSANLPVGFLDLAAGWRAVDRWSPGYLSRVLGLEPVEVMTARDSDADFEVNSARHAQTMPFADYVDYVTSSSWSNDKYLVANNHLLEKAAATPLWADFDVDERYLDPARTQGTVFLWFGPGGTVTPLHHDVANVLFVQVYGRKLVRLISPLDTHCVYNDIGVYSEVDAAQPDLLRHPNYERVRQFNVLMEPGQALFIPVGWWHHVTALDTSISLSFTNFRWPNSFTWHHPRGTR